ncbi:hypothetical protein L6164_012995 [Bauhinia variegata]|uniref:Uncharacterized protein n=1 Tax=Bauhinia variegata TaxID=167791 RepID=A0ACB9PD89_BAUVA|nr:hypothetical protein L6164_012995 [Bauhinia variegata]
MMASEFASSPAGNLFDLIEFESELPAEIAQKFKKIRNKFEEGKFQWFWLFPSFDSISLLDDLNHVLAECQILKLQRANIKKKVSHFFHPSEKNSLQRLNSLWSSFNDKLQESEANGNSSTNPNSQAGESIVSFEAEESSIVGFDKQEQTIVNWLSCEGFKAIGIYGMSGSGKSALVSKVLKNERVRDKFYPIIRICLFGISTKEQLDIKVVKHILEELGHDVDEYTGKRRHASPVDELRSSLKSQKFLLVLDDVWFCNDWFVIKPDKADDNGDLFSHAFPKDTDGAVIVTSRLKEVAEKIVGKKYLFHLQPLEKANAECLEAFVRENVLDKSEADEVIRCFHGLPLAAKTVANVIVEDIQTVLEEKIVERVSSDGFKPIGIFWRYGSNKTIHLKRILENPSIRDVFYPIIWVDLSGISSSEHLDIKIVKYILEELGHDIDEMTGTLENFTLIEELNHALKSQKYLLVLDNVSINLAEKGGIEDIFSLALPENTDGAIIVASREKDAVERIVGLKMMFLALVWIGCWFSGTEEDVVEGVRVGAAVLKEGAKGLAIVVVMQ